jgi:hypothetical protein
LPACLLNAREADELARGLHFNRPPAVASLVELDLELRDGGIALFTEDEAIMPGDSRASAALAFAWRRDAPAPSRWPPSGVRR